MSKYAIFPDEKSAREFILTIDTAYGFPNADAKTYAEPAECKDGTWTVKIKDWLRAPCASARWTKMTAVTACAELSPQKILDARPELTAESAPAPEAV